MFVYSSMYLMRSLLWFRPQRKKVGDMCTWSYRTQNEWGAQFPISVFGNRQSPIDIRENEVTKESRSPFKLELIEGNTKSEWSLVNNGRTFRVEPPTEVKWQLSGGVLEGKYILDHFHGHWGHVKGHGSEHLLDGERFDGETHFVFKLAEGQEGIEDTFVAWGFLMKEVADTDPKLKPVLDDLIASNLSKIGAAESSVKIPGVDLTPFMESKQGQQYFAYKGSLTTPPFAECVLHVVFKEPLLVSNKLMDLLRDLDDDSGGKTTINYRALQPLKGRKVYMCST